MGSRSRSTKRQSSYHRSPDRHGYGRSRSKHSETIKDRSRDRKRSRNRDRSRDYERLRDRRSSRDYDKSRDYERSRTSGYNRTASVDRDVSSGRHAKSSTLERRHKNYRFDSPPKAKLQSSNFGVPEFLSRQEADMNGSVSSIGLDPLATKPYREIYIGNIPPLNDVSHLLEFINAALTAVNGTSIPGNPCLKGWISSDGHYAFIELRTMEEASNCMQLTGLNYMGYNIRVNRPKTYTPEMLALAPSPTVPTLDPSLLAMGLEALKGATEQIAAASAILAAEKAKVLTDRLCIIGITEDMKEDDIKSAIESIGQIKYYHFVREPNVQRVCIFEYTHIEQQKRALEDLPKRGFRVIMAVDAVYQGILDPNYIRQQLESCELMRSEIPTRALLLGNLVSNEELEDDAEYVDIIDDVKTECEEYGQVLRLELPRVPKGLTKEEMDTVDTSCVGSAFVLFSTVEGASKARKILGGRKFGNRTVEAHFFSELLFHIGNFANPKPNFSREHSSLYNTKIIEDPNSAASILYELENSDHPVKDQQ